MLDFEPNYSPDLTKRSVKSLLDQVESSEMVKLAEGLNEQFAERLKSVILEASEITAPHQIKVMDGSKEEWKDLLSLLTSEGTLIRLNEEEYHDSYLHRSNPHDVARTEGDTYICTSGNKDDVGPTNNWMHSEEAKETLNGILKNSMSGRTMYVVPYWLGPLGSEYAKGGIEITDSPYVVANLMIITRAGESAVREIAHSGDFVLGIHSMKNLDSENRYICHFPEENLGQGLIISVNSNYGGNALLSKKCHALRISSVRGRNEDWLAEHMMLIGIREPNGQITYISGAFPSASGKTNLSMLDPPKDMKEKGWKTELISDDIIWMYPSEEGFNAVNPENGFFGVVPGTSMKTNPNAMRAIKTNTIFTNVALDDQNIPYWEGLGPAPEKLTDWKGNPYRGEGKAAHPNSRFTTPIENYPYLSEEYNNVSGVPVSAILYGGRRKDLVPLVYQAYSWEHGVLIGAMERVETTAAAVGKVGVLRNDPMAIRPFLGYNMADYFAHHLRMGKVIEKPPEVFNVNWFRRDEKGEFIWPGFSENTRVIKWILDRLHGNAGAVETPIGFVPDLETFDSGNTGREDMERLLKVDSKGFLKELEEVRPFLESFGDRLPKTLWVEFQKLEERLQSW